MEEGAKPKSRFVLSFLTLIAGSAAAFFGTLIVIDKYPQISGGNVAQPVQAEAQRAIKADPSDRVGSATALDTIIKKELPNNTYTSEVPKFSFEYPANVTISSVSDKAESKTIMLTSTTQANDMQQVHVMTKHLVPTTAKNPKTGKMEKVAPPAVTKESIEKELSSSLVGTVEQTTLGGKPAFIFSMIDAELGLSKEIRVADGEYQYEVVGNLSFGTELQTVVASTWKY